MGELEKSITLCNLIGWRVSAHIDGWYTIYDGDRLLASMSVKSTLYQPDLMALAWKVLNWAAGNFPHDDYYEGGYAMDWWFSDYTEERDGGAYSVIDLDPAEAQAAWLDKIYELATQAGLIGVDYE